MPLDANLPALGDGAIKYPLRYGYACVGRIEQVGSSADEVWVGRTVFPSATRQPLRQRCVRANPGT